MQRPHPYGGYSAGPPPRSQDHGGMGPGPNYAGSQYGSMPPQGGPQGMQQSQYGPPPPSQSPGVSYNAGRPPYSVAPPQQGGPPPYGAGASYGGNPQSHGPAGPPYGAPHSGPPHQRPYQQRPPAGPHGAAQRPAYNGAYGVGGPGAGGSRAPSYGSEDDFSGRKRARVDENSGAVDPSHEQFLKERLKRERPCRTLFVRNVDFQANVGELRNQFESFGEIKSFFDLVEKRGLAFISYFDLRPAEAAKNAMQGMRINGRELDVHYSLPRESETTKRCERDKDQGTLFVVLKKAPHDLSDDELMVLFSQFGEVKNLRRYKDQGNCRFLEYWDCRACKDAHDALIGSEYRGGTWDVKFAWDAAAPDRVADLPREAREREWARVGQAASANGPSNHARPFRPPTGPGRPDNANRPPYPGPGNAYGPRPPNQSGAYPPPRPTPPQTYASSAPYGTKRPYDYDDGQGQDQSHGPSYGASPYGAPPSGNMYGGPSPSVPGIGSYSSPARPGAYQSPPVGSAAPSSSATGGYGGDDRLEQAQRVQQMLASLKSGSGAGVKSPNGQGNAVGPPASSPPVTKPGNSAGSAEKPGLPSSIAALLQMAQQQSAQKK